MKSTVWQIILKDTRRLWPLLTLWALALAARAGLPALMDAGGSSAGREEGLFAGLLVFLVNAQLAAKVLAEDSPVRATAFWRTRPIGGGQMLAAKLIFLGVWTLAVPAGVAVASAAGYGFTSGEAARMIAGQLTFHALIGLIFFVAALFTERVWTSLLVVWLVATVGGALLAAVRLGGQSGSGLNVGAFDGTAASLLLTRWMLAGLAILSAVALAAILVYRDRRRVVAGIAILSGVVAAGSVLNAWPLDLLAAVPRWRVFDARNDPSFHATVATADGHENRSTVDGVRYRAVAARVRWMGLEDGQACLPYQVEGTLVWPDGAQWRDARTLDENAMEHIYSAIRTMTAERRAPSRRNEPASASLTLANIPEAELAKHGNTGAEWRGKIWVRLGRVEPEWRMRPGKGGRIAQGARRAVVEDATVEGGRLRLTLFERRPDQARWRLEDRRRDPFSTWPVFLVNVAHGESVRSEERGSRATYDGLFQTQRSEMSFTLPRGGEPGVEWFEGAELIRFRFVEERLMVVEASCQVRWLPQR